ncbi:hypothetical protein LWI28_012105 [Acer negundo]|uniref:Transposase MuDR plant domain-containing protein n=1 Tax=Acer negundo TaxID=4023 RepID=A0AAD5JKW8_ACENE|nr:hypothetical protein LWI28_012105 [Acer negundo]
MRFWVMGFVVMVDDCGLGLMEGGQSGLGYGFRDLVFVDDCGMGPGFCDLKKEAYQGGLQDPDNWCIKQQQVMASFIISAKFLGSQVEFAIQNLDQYTLGSLWADVYMCTCATFPEPTETFKAEVKLPWSGDYKVLNDDRDLQITQHSAKRVGQSTVEVMDLSINDDGNNGEQLPSYASLPSEDDEDYVPNSNCSMSKTSSDILPESADVQSDSDTDSDDEQLSNAASFTWNNDFMEQESSDDEGGGVQKPSQGPRGRPYRQFAGGSSFGGWSVVQQHLVLRDYVVQEGFELKRIKNAKERYTAECVYEGCSWRIHASPIDDRTGFMIKTMNDRHCCQKVHKNQEANASWVAHRFRAMIEENPEITVKLLGREIQRIYGLSIPTYTLYRAKNRVLNKAEKEHVTSYNSFYSYGYCVR